MYIFTHIFVSIYLCMYECTVKDNCKSSPCKNGAKCTSSADSFSCACPVGFTGADCGTGQYS